MDIINAITAYIEGFATHRIALAVLIGLAVSLAGTQWLKFVFLRVARLPNPTVLGIRAMALPLGAAATFVVLPHEMEWIVRAMIGLMVGLVAPYVYRLITAVLYRLWPDLEQRLSVDPYGDERDKS